MMGILVPETCWGNKTAYLDASGWFFTFQLQDYVLLFAQYKHVNGLRHCAFWFDLQVLGIIKLWFTLQFLCKLIVWHLLLWSDSSFLEVWLLTLVVGLILSNVSHSTLISYDMMKNSRTHCDIHYGVLEWFCYMNFVRTLFSFICWCPVKYLVMYSPVGLKIFLHNFLSDEWGSNDHSIMTVLVSCCQKVLVKKCLLNYYTTLQLV
jgi:hypothetical protein